MTQRKDTVTRDYWGITRRGANGGGGFILFDRWLTVLDGQRELRYHGEPNHPLFFETRMAARTALRLMAENREERKLFRVVRVRMRLEVI